MLLPFFFNDPTTTEIYTLSLHDALPISIIFFIILHTLAQYFFNRRKEFLLYAFYATCVFFYFLFKFDEDRKSTRLNSSHSQSSYAVFCLKKKRSNVLTAACGELSQRHQR